MWDVVCGLGRGKKEEVEDRRKEGRKEEGGTCGVEGGCF